jgi:hypothetical protein
MCPTVTQFNVLRWPARASLNGLMVAYRWQLPCHFDSSTARMEKSPRSKIISFVAPFALLFSEYDVHGQECLLSNKSVHTCMRTKITDQHVQE